MTLVAQGLKKGECRRPEPVWRKWTDCKEPRERNSQRCDRNKMPTLQAWMMFRRDSSGVLGARN